MKTFDERLDLLLDKYKRYIPDETPDSPSIRIELKCAILQLIKEVVPEEKDPYSGYLAGWNAYRTELLKRLGIEK